MLILEIVKESEVAGFAITIFGIVSFGLFIGLVIGGGKQIIKGVKGFETRDLGALKLQAILNGKGVKISCSNCGKTSTNGARNSFQVVEQENGKSAITSVYYDVVCKVRMLPQNV